MTLTTRAQLVAGQKCAQRPLWGRVQLGANSGQSNWASLFNTLFNNPVGVLAGTSTTQGVVPDSTTAGCLPLDSFNGGTGYLAQVEIAAELIPGYKLSLYDLLFKSGAHNFNATDTLASQPSYSARLPGTDYTLAEIWIENVTAFTGTASIVITYTNESGTTGRTAVTTSPISVGANLLTRVPLQAGDRGVQKIESVTSTVASAGTFNVLVMRPLVKDLKTGTTARTGNHMDLFGPDITGLPIVYDTTAFYYMLATDAGGSILTHEVKLEIVVV